MSENLIEFNNISKFFGKVIALKDVTMKLKKGEIMCLLGDNGAGKSTLIKTLAGVHKPDEGEIVIEGEKTVFDSPKDALDLGIGTVYQDLALVPLMSVTRNFFMGREPLKGLPLLKTFDIEKANKIAAERMGQIGIDVRDPSQAVGTMSGGERQCLAISRAIYFGAKVLVLDEPTSALGVHQASMVLKYIVKAASEGLAVILITHNVHHAYPVGNSFTVLNRGRSLGTFNKKDITFAQKHLRILSGLYGELRPLDVIKPYRLEMGTKLKNSKGKNLYEFWGNKVQDNILKELKTNKSNLIVNLASKEYFTVVGSLPEDVEVVSPVFKDFKNGQFKIISFFAKKARGRMCRFIIKNKLTSSNALHKFKDNGYAFDKKLSTQEARVIIQK